MFISGIASGIDTDALITQLLAIERRPMLQMQQRKDLLVQQRDAWRDINTRLNTLRERIGALRDASVFFSRIATSSNEGAITAKAAGNAAEATYEIQVQQLAQAHRVASFKFDDPDASLGFITTPADIKINGVDITVDSGDSLRSIAQKINEAEGVGVTATIIDGRLVLRANRTGEDHGIEIDGPAHLVGGTFDEHTGPTGLGLLDSDGEFYHELVEARDAKFVIEGVEVTRSSNTISDLFEGVTFTLHGVGDAVVTIERNVDDVVSKVKAFVDQYNSVQSFMASVSGSGENRAQRGVLSGDGLLMQIQSQLRMGVTNAVAQAGVPYAQLMSIGISVDRYGTMTLNETKLRDALADDAEAVFRLFAAKKDASDPDSFDGVAVRLEETFQGWLRANTGVLAERQKMFGNQMRTIEQSIERLERRLELREISLMRQFTALEQVLAQLQSQGMWLEGQIQQMNALSGQRGR